MNRETTIGQLIQATRKQQTMPSSNSSWKDKPEAQAWLRKWQSPSEVEAQFSPIHWGYTINNADKAYMADCPTLAQYGELYGPNFPADWVRIQVIALYGTSTNRDKGVADGIRLFAEAFAAEVRQYKLSELMLFFARYKAGRYDNSYASFDAKRIGNAFFKEFLKERPYEMDKAERSRNQQQIEARRFTPPPGYSSLSWYQELRARASTGDQEAISMLQGPHNS